MLRVSVIIPTYNRAKYIGATIDSFINQTYSKDYLEIIICDNHCTDETKELVDRYIDKNITIKIRYIFEGHQGSHYARNSAAKIASGDILYFTDDDMIADHQMIEKIVRIFEQFDNIGAVTGKVIPRWEVEPPKWVEQFLNNQWLSLLDKNMKICITEYDLGVYSCHEAIPRELFMSTGGFHPDIIGTEWVGDGETGFNKELEEKGYYFAYVGDAVTQHMIPPSRMTQRYLNRRLMCQGNSDSYTEFRRCIQKNQRYKISETKYIIPLFNKWIRTFVQAIRRKSSIRFMISYYYYYKARKLYDRRLKKDDEWRMMVLQTNWLKED